MTSTSAPSKSELVYVELRRRIIDGTYTPGYRLVLGHVAELFGFSSVPVREALRLLEAEGLVVHRKNIGAEVAGIDPVDFADAMQATALLEGYATSLAAAHLTSVDLARAGEINDEMRALRGEVFDPLRFTRLNQAFHTVLCRPCPNRHLSDLLARETDRLSSIRRSTFSYVPSRSRSSVEEHDELLRLLRTEPLDLGEIERVARGHKLNTLRHFLERGEREHAGD